MDVYFSKAKITLALQLRFFGITIHKGYVMQIDLSIITRFLLRFKTADASEDIRKLGINIITASIIGMFLADKTFGYGLIASTLVGFIVWITGLFIEPRS